MDLEIGLQDANQSFRLSEHVFGKDANPNFCFPRGMNWNNKAKVYFILPVKEQGRWVYHFINQITIASSLTGDTSFHVIVVDFESEDIDMTKAFNTTLLRNRHTIVPLKGKFYKTMALNKAVEHVPSVHDILFLFDLHIDVPVDILDSARKVSFCYDFSNDYLFINLHIYVVFILEIHDLAGFHADTDRSAMNWHQ